MPTITNDSFSLGGNTFQTDPPADQGDSFGLGGNVFDNTQNLNDSFTGGGNTVVARRSNSLFANFSVPPTEDVSAFGYVFENVTLATADVLVAAYLSMNVTDEIPTPHIWYLIPDEGNRGDVIAIIGHGFGEIRETYNGQISFGSTIPAVLSWNLIPPGVHIPADREINAETDVVTSEHNRVTFRIPSNAVPADVRIITDTDAATQPPAAPPVSKFGSDSASGAEAEALQAMLVSADAAVGTEGAALVVTLTDTDVAVGTEDDGTVT